MTELHGPHNITKVLVPHKIIVFWDHKLRVATAQGEQRIWLLTFPDRENTGNSVNLIFLHKENFENIEFFENFVVKVATRWEAICKK